jgi:predicted dehydrogenase
MPHILSQDLVDEAVIVERNFVNRFIARRLTRCKVVKSLEAIDLDSIDVGIVLTPSASHYELTSRLLNAGIHCFVEKPMSVTWRESAELCRLATEKCVTLRVGYVYRWSPVFRHLKGLLESGVFGRPCGVSLAMRGNVVGPNSKITWRSSGPGSGCLFDFGSHMVDLAVFLFGSFDSVDSVKGESVYTRGGVDRFSARLLRQTALPDAVTVTADWSDESARKAVVEVRVEFDSAMIIATPQVIKISSRGTEDEISISDLDTNVSFYLRGEDFASQWDDFFKVLETEQQSDHVTSIPDDVVDRLLEMIYQELE